MSVRCPSAWVLAVTLLLSGSLGVIDHDHDLFAGPERAPCAVDHSDADSGARSDEIAGETEIGRAGAGHDHDCLACHLARSRWATGASASASLQPLLAAKAAFAAITAAPELAESASRSARGPPRG